MEAQKRRESRQNKSFMIAMTGSAYTRSRSISPHKGGGFETEEQMSDQPTEQEIADYLAGLNRVVSAALVTAETAAAKAKGIANYKRWFKSHGIAICEDRSGLWKRVEKETEHG